MAHVKISETNPIHYQDATTLAALIRTKKVSSREVVQAHRGEIWVEARPGGGAIFSISLPIAEVMPA